MRPQKIDFRFLFYTLKNIAIANRRKRKCRIYIATFTGPVPKFFDQILPLLFQ